MWTKELGIIGVGNMGSALLKGILNSKIIKSENIIIYDINKDILNKKAQEFNIQVAKDNINLVQSAKFVLLAVKPQVIDLVLGEIASNLKPQNVLISIAAGITISHISSLIKNQIGIIRVMPNTPALVGAGSSAISHNQSVSIEDLNYTKNLFNSVGIIVEVEEKHMDAVTALSGSGPAYIFVIIEALADGGVKMGLSRDIAVKLAAQTVFGSAKMILETGKHPGLLKDMVTSPGGTTIAALHELEKGKLRATIMNAVEAATLKSKTLK
jgi:pyrroline-5-carboxylate reductase